MVATRESSVIAPRREVAVVDRECRPLHVAVPDSRSESIRPPGVGRMWTDPGWISLLIPQHVRVHNLRKPRAGEA